MTVYCRIKHKPNKFMANDGTAISTEGTLPSASDAQNRNLKWHSVSASETGYVRAVNEDAHLDAREHSLWVVADGMGGHSYGDKASRAIIDQLVSFEQLTEMTESLRDIEHRLALANSFCRDQANGKVMGSTVAAMFAHDPYCFFMWAGDSRIYRFRNNTLEQMTVDHSFVQELVTLGELKKEEMEQHPSSNIITRAIGVHSELELETNYALAEPGDRYLICSDGLFKDVSHDEIADGMACITAEETIRTLTDLALERGGRDNITAIVVQAETN